MTISNKVEGLDLAELEKVAREATLVEWEVVDYQGGSIVIHSDDEHRVCFMATPGDSPGEMERIEANAVHIATFDPPTVLRLIEANRELLAALESALNGLVAAQPVLSFVPKNYGGEGRRKAVDAGITAARAAIAKVQP